MGKAFSPKESFILCLIIVSLLFSQSQGLTYDELVQLQRENEEFDSLWVYTMRREGKLRSVGETCGSDDDCISKICVDGHCCTDRGQRWSNSSTTCYDAGRTGLENGELCDANEQCATSNCAERHCCDQDRTWSSTSRKCYDPRIKLRINQECEVNEQCISNNCGKGHCCNKGQEWRIYGCHTVAGLMLQVGLFIAIIVIFKWDSIRPSLEQDLKIIRESLAGPSMNPSEKPPLPEKLKRICAVLGVLMVLQSIGFGGGLLALITMGVSIVGIKESRKWERQFPVHETRPLMTRIRDFSEPVLERFLLFGFVAGLLSFFLLVFLLDWADATLYRMFADAGNPLVGNAAVSAVVGGAFGLAIGFALGSSIGGKIVTTYSIAGVTGGTISGFIGVMVSGPVGMEGIVLYLAAGISLALGIASRRRSAIVRDLSAGLLCGLLVFSMQSKSGYVFLYLLLGACLGLTTFLNEKERLGPGKEGKEGRPDGDGENGEQDEKGKGEEQEKDGGDEDEDGADDHEKVEKE